MCVDDWDIAYYSNMYIRKRKGRGLRKNKMVVWTRVWSNCKPLDLLVGLLLNLI